MRRHLRILWQFWRASLMQAMEYRTSFFLAMAANAIDFTVGLGQYALFFTVAERVAGWDMPQMLAFYGVFMTVFALHFIFLYPNLAAISRLVNTGALDLLLVRPVSAQFLLSFRLISFEEVGSLLAAQVLLAALWLSGLVRPDLGQAVAFLVALAVSFTLVYSLFVCLLALGLWLEKLENTADLMWTMFGLCRYPADIYPRSLHWLFFGLLPIGFVSTVPAAVLFQPIPGTRLAIGVVVALLATAVSRSGWKRALAGYTSAGG